MSYYGYIYKITNLVTGTVYIGEHRHVPGEAWTSYMGSSNYLDQEKRSYGLENFKKEWIAWTENEVQALLLEARYISKQLAKEGFCYNSSNSYALHRDPQENTKHFAFKASFRPKTRLRAIIKGLTALGKQASDDLAEQTALSELVFAHKLALHIKQRRVEATGRLDDADSKQARS